MENIMLYLLVIGVVRHWLASLLICVNFLFLSTVLLLPSKIQKVLENDFKDFIPDVRNNIFVNNYDIKLEHFNPNINVGISEYERRIERFLRILNEKKKIYFVYFNEDYLYNPSFRKTEYINEIFSQMLKLDFFLREKYPHIDYNILYFNFIERTIPTNSNIINIVLSANYLFDNSNGLSHDTIRIYCGKVLSELFNTNVNHVIGHDLFLNY